MDTVLSQDGIVVLIVYNVTNFQYLPTYICVILWNWCSFFHEKWISCLLLATDSHVFRAVALLGPGVSFLKLLALNESHDLINRFTCKFHWIHFCSMFLSCITSGQIYHWNIIIIIIEFSLNQTGPWSQAKSVNHEASLFSHCLGTQCPLVAAKVFLRKKENLWDQGSQTAQCEEQIKHVLDVLLMWLCLLWIATV